MGLLLTVFLALVCACGPVGAQDKPVEIHDRIADTLPSSKHIALTLDACSGRFDDDLIEYLIRNQIPATLFATKKWLLANPQGVAIIKAHLDLFDVEDHGENHIPAVIGFGKKVYGIQVSQTFCTCGAKSRKARAPSPNESVCHPTGTAAPPSSAWRLKSGSRM